MKIIMVLQCLNDIYSLFTTSLLLPAPSQTDIDTYPEAVMTTGYFCEFWNVGIVHNVEKEHDGFSFRN